MMNKLRVIVFLSLGFFLISPATPVQAQDMEYPIYYVQSGDTLSLIAMRFGVSLQDLIDLNQINDPNAISEGTALKIPGYSGISGELEIKTVNLGEDYLSLTNKNRFQWDLLQRLNRLVSPEEIYVGSSLIIPKVAEGAQLKPFTILSEGQTLLDIAVKAGKNPWAILLENGLNTSSNMVSGDTLYHTGDALLPLQFSPAVSEFSITPLPLAQGKTILIRLKTNEPMTISGLVAGYPPSFFKIGENEYVALLGIHARKETGINRIELVGYDSAGEEKFSIEQNVLIESGYWTDDPPIFVDPITIQPDVIEPEQALIDEIVRKVSPEKYWSGIFQYPVDDPCLSAYFGGNRVYNNSYHYYHTGVDFNVCKANNINIYSVASGYVVYTGNLVVRGNAVIIDHGWGVFSGYWHQSEMLVQPGDYVEAGDLIGYIGNTGRSTGSHLHLEVWVNSVQVNPLDWLQNTYP